MATPIGDVLDDLRAEYARIDELLGALSDAQWTMPSSAPGWSVADTVLHLALTEEAIPTVIESDDASWTTRDVPLDDVVEQNVRYEVASPDEVYARWRAASAASLDALAAADPGRPVKWAAAPLRPRTLATTRLAEHWAHVLDIAEPLDLPYPDTDRLRHVAWLGHATLPYALGLDGHPPVDVYCSLTAPSGTTIELGPPDAATTIRGELGTFCRVGARRVAGSRSGLEASGPDADVVLRVLRNYAA